MANGTDPSVEQLLYDATHIDEINIHDEYVKLPGQLAYWVAQAATAYEGRLAAELRLETTEATCYLDHRHAATLVTVPEGKKPERVTDTFLQSSIRKDPRWQSAQSELNRALSNEARIKGVVKAVETKRDMLVSLGAQIRSEVNGNPTIRNTAQIASAVRSANQPRDPLDE